MQPAARFAITTYELKCIICRFSDITNDDLERIVLDIKESMPAIGERMMLGALHSRGSSTMSSCSSNTSQSGPFRHSKTKHKPYSVPGPNSLWHIGENAFVIFIVNCFRTYILLDGNHKLVRWRMVVHGAIDGFSRMLLYLHRCSNNKATTVLSLFIQVVNEYGLPSRVQTDQGLEKVSS